MVFFSPKVYNATELLTGLTSYVLAIDFMLLNTKQEEKDAIWKWTDLYKTW